MGVCARLKIRVEAGSGQDFHITGFPKPALLVDREHGNRAIVVLDVDSGFTLGIEKDLCDSNGVISMIAYKYMGATCIDRNMTWEYAHGRHLIDQSKRAGLRLYGIGANAPAGANPAAKVFAFVGAVKKSPIR